MSGESDGQSKASIAPVLSVLSPQPFAPSSLDLPRNNVTLTLVFTVLLVALVFEYINGFHDTANSIATVVATKVLSPGQAVLLAAITNLLGAMWGTAVAKTISSGLIDAGVVAMTPELLICALLGATIWDLITWWWGLPSSSSHALIGGLCGAALAAASDNWNAMIWSVPAEHWWLGKGLLNKVVLPMIVSPAAGFAARLHHHGLAVRAAVVPAGARRARSSTYARPRVVNAIFAKVQIVSSGFMGFSHGLNDAQKTMGIIALALAGATTAGSLDHLPAWLAFPARRSRPEADSSRSRPGSRRPAPWSWRCGTMVGGWRIIRTLGHKMVKLHPINGVAADIGSSSVILTASALGIPVSTTHNVSAAIMGVGAAKRLERDQVDRGRAHGLGVDSYPAGVRCDRLPAGKGANDGRAYRRLERVAAGGNRFFQAIAERADFVDQAVEFFFREQFVGTVFAQVQVGRAIQIADREIAHALFPVETQAALGVHAGQRPDWRGDAQDISGRPRRRVQPDTSLDGACRLR